MPQYLTMLMRERGRHYVCRILVPPPTPQYLTILTTERGGANIFGGFYSFKILKISLYILWQDFVASLRGQISSPTPLATPLYEDIFLCVGNLFLFMGVFFQHVGISLYLFMSRRGGGGVVWTCPTFCKILCGCP